mgnify:CR=1 FL=1
MYTINFVEDKETKINTKTIVAGSILSLWVSQGFGEQRNIGTKLYKLEDENMVGRFIKRGTNKENVREQGNIG